MEKSEKREIMDKEAMKRAIGRIACEIIERNHGLENVVVIGIQRRGVVFAKRIVEKLFELEQIKVPVGVLDITLYRDDLSLLSKHPVINGTEIDFLVDDKKIVLIDDVLYTGRTVRAAIDAIMELGRPSLIQLAVMIDRGHRELPIRADYVGKNVPTSRHENIEVMVEEIDNTDQVILYDKEV